MTGKGYILKNQNEEILYLEPQPQERGHDDGVALILKVLNLFSTHETLFTSWERVLAGRCGIHENHTPPCRMIDVSLN